MELDDGTVACDVGDGIGRWDGSGTMLAMEMFELGSVLILARANGTVKRYFD